MLRRRQQWTTKVESWEFGFAVDVSIWVFGIYYENAIREFTLLFGPLSVWCAHEHDTERYWPSASFYLRRWDEYELRADWSTHQLLFEYAHSGYKDHSLYLGPIDVQLEHRANTADDKSNP